MGRFTRHGMDNQPLEGGGGGGSGIASKIAGTGVAATVLTPMYMAIQKADERDKMKREAAAGTKREADAEVKRESRGVEKSGTDKARDAAKVITDDEKYTKETPEQKLAAGGTASSRADGIAQRGKTRGTIIK